MDAQLPAKFQKKVMNQFWVTAKNIVLWPKWALLGPFCPNKGKYDFFKKIWISQILASMDAKLLKKVMEQSWGIAINVFVWTNGPFLGPFCPNKGKYDFFLENPASSLFYIYGCPTSCKILEKTNEPIPGKACHGRTNERTNGRTNGRTESMVFLLYLFDI